MRVAGEKNYEIDQVDSVSEITDDLTQLLASAVSAFGERRPVRVTIMFNLEEA